MKCLKCNKEIKELETLCDECKKNIENQSYNNNLEKLEELIENQKKLGELEKTKELADLKNLAQENEFKDQEEKTQVFKIIKEKQIEDKEKLNKEKNKSKKKKIILISSALLIILIFIFLFIFLNKEQKEEKEIKIDYENVIKKYGNSISKLVKEYISNNNNVPTWQYIIEILDYKKYEVECDNHNIYSDGSIYLSKCKVNNKKVKYTYGKEIEETKEGKKINIYKSSDEKYSAVQNNSFKFVGNITCKTEFCEYVYAYDKFVVIKENEKYYLYDYENDLLNFGPFILDSDKNILVQDNNLYGIYYFENNEFNIYNVKTGKILKNIKGNLLSDETSLNPSIMYKYNYVITYNDNKYDFINLKTGNVSYSIKENINSFIEDSNIVYITVYDKSNTKFKIYNSNGKLLFNGQEFSKFQIRKDYLVLATETNFKVYDKNLKLKTASKEYNTILDVNKDFVVVLQDNDLILLDISAKELAKFEDGWDNQSYIFHPELSGWYTLDNQNVIYLIIENNLISSGNYGNGIKYYYIPSKEESGIIKTKSINDI